MKPTLVLLTLSAFLALSLSAQNPAQNPVPTTQPAEPVSTAFAVTQRAANSQVWERSLIEPGSRGKSFARKHKFVELQTGLNFLKNGAWLASSETIEIQPDGGALAQQGQHQVYFPGSLYSDALRVTTPDAKDLVSRPLGLCFADDERSVLIAELRDGPVGQLLQSGKDVIFTNITENCRLDLLVSYRKASVESDLIIREQLPDASNWGFSDPSKVVIQWWTEFFSPPEPQQAQPDGSSDTTLNFGQMSMPQGKAYLSGVEGQPQNPVPVQKAWVHMQNRTFLVESIPLSAIFEQLASLPAHSAAVPPRNSAVFARSSHKARSASFSSSLAAPKSDGGGAATLTTLPLARPPVHASRPIQIAKSDYRHEPGFTTDYILLNSGETNYVFAGDTTYEISGPTIVGGSNTVFEGGAALKFDVDATLTITTPVTWLGKDYAPVCLLAVDDDSAGEVLPISTGAPGTDAYADTALYFDALTAVTNLNLQSLRIANARTAIAINGRSGHILSDVQLINCINGLALTNAEVSLRNALFSGVLTNFTGSSSTGRVEHLTSDAAIWLNKDIGVNLFLTNSLLVAVTNLGNYTTLQNVNIQSTAGGVFQIVGGASYYLTEGSTNRQAGTTNISPALLASLKHKTTYPPLVYSNVTISADTTFSPQAPRGTGLPDLGWAYAPLDYVFGGTEAAANLTFAPGTAVGWFKDNLDGNNEGIHLDDTQTASFNGTAESPAYWVRTTTVQEGSTQDWDGAWNTAGITGSAWPDFGQSPKVILRFTRCSILADDSTHFRDDYGYLTVQATHCEFWGGSLGGYASLLTYTNCLLDRAAIWTSWDGIPDLGCSLILQNCTMHAASLNPNRWAPDGDGNYPLWLIHDSAFDATMFEGYDDSGASLAVNFFDYNAFLSGAGRTNPQGSNDVIVTNFNWVAGPLGNYYQVTNSPLINHGSTNAQYLGLFHFTTMTNLVSGLEIKEMNSIVDISYHYVATDANGKAQDADGDGIPDYLEDSNGDSVFNTGDLSDWRVYNSSHGLATGTGLQVFTPLK